MAYTTRPNSTSAVITGSTLDFNSEDWRRELHGVQIKQAANAANAPSDLVTGDDFMIFDCYMYNPTQSGIQTLRSADYDNDSESVNIWTRVFQNSDFTSWYKTVQTKGLLTNTEVKLDNYGNLAESRGLKMVGEAIYTLSTSQGDINDGDIIKFDNLSSFMGDVSAISPAGDGFFDVDHNYKYRVESFCAQHGTNTNNGMAWQSKGSVNTTVFSGTYGGSATASATDRNMGASAPSYLLFDPNANDSQSVRVWVECTGWRNQSAYRGNANIPSSYFRISIYKQV